MHIQRPRNYLPQMFTEKPEDRKSSIGRIHKKPNYSNLSAASILLAQDESDIKLESIGKVVDMKWKE